MPQISVSKCKLCESSQLITIDSDTHICKCTSCGFIFNNPYPSCDDIQLYYSNPAKYDIWMENIEEREKLWRRRLTHVKKWKKKGNLLDIGTGIGQFLHVAKNDFTETHGTEISKSAIQIAKINYSLEIIEGSIENINFLSKKYDNITLFHVLEHVEHPKDVIKKCYDILTDGGILFIAVPNDVQSIKAKVKDLLKKIRISRFASTGVFGLPKITLDGSVDEIHLSHFTQNVLTITLNREGFEVLECSIEPYFVSSGHRHLLQNIYYLAHKVILRLSGLNLYDTIWIVAKKPTK